MPAACTGRVIDVVWLPPIGGCSVALGSSSSCALAVLPAPTATASARNVRSPRAIFRYIVIPLKNCQQQPHWARRMVLFSIAEMRSCGVAQRTTQALKLSLICKRNGRCLRKTYEYGFNPLFDLQPARCKSRHVRVWRSLPSIFQIIWIQCLNMALQLSRRMRSCSIAKTQEARSLVSRSSCRLDTR